MKKISILAVCALVGVGAMAQESVLKDAEKAQKSGKDFSEVVKIITPAFTDPSTSGNVDTYYIPGKTAFGQYDKYLGLKQLGQSKPEQEAAMPELLLGGFEYYLKALPYDSVPNEKGKVKTKRSKDIVSTLGAHHSDLINAGLQAFDAENFSGAYNAWNYYVTLPEVPAIAKNMMVVPADSTRSDIAFNMALAAFRMNDLQKSLDAFLLAEKLGYTYKRLYDYAIDVATQLGDQETVNMLAEKAIPLYGDEDPNYVGFIVNGYINSGDYAKALDFVNNAIADKPNNAQYYVTKGVLLENDGAISESRECYKKAAELDKNNKVALYNYGRALFNEAVNLYNNTPEGPEFGKIFNEQFKPLMLEAVDYLEAAYALDNDYADPLRTLLQAYYLLNDDVKYNETENRLKYL